MKNSFQKNVENFIYSIVYDSLCVCSVAHLYPTLCDPLNCSWPGSSIHGIFQARVMEQVATSCSRQSTGPMDRTHVSSSPALAGRFFTTLPPGKRVRVYVCVCAHTSGCSKSLQSCPTVCDPTDRSPTRSSVQGIL